MLLNQIFKPSTLVRSAAVFVLAGVFEGASAGEGKPEREEIVSRVRRILNISRLTN